MKLVFTLHCETGWNIRGLLQGDIDTVLHAVGIAHAYRKADVAAARHRDVARIVSSDLRRGVETAKIINYGLNVIHEIDPRLRECTYGSLQGSTKEELAVIRGGWDDSFLEYDYREFGGECRDDVLKRQLEALGDLKRKYPGETVLIVGHGTSINTLFAALGEPDLPFRRNQFRVIEY